MHFNQAPDGRRWPLIERGLLDQGTVEALRGVFAEAFKIPPEKKGSHNSLSFGHVWRSTDRELTDTAIRSMLEGGGGEKLRWLLGNDLVFLVDNCSMRFHEPEKKESHLGFHLDADFTGLVHLMVNLWVPLDRVGETSPSLTFLSPKVDGGPLIKEWRDMIDSKDDPRRPLVRARYTLQNILAVAQEQGVDAPFYTPVLNPGDVALFNQFIVHATQPLRNHTEIRRSFEFRVATDGKVPSFYHNRRLPRQSWSWIDGTWVVKD